MADGLFDALMSPYLGRGAQIAILHADIHRTKSGCCCPGQSVACPSCPQHASAHAPCPTCGHSIAPVVELDKEQQA